MKKVLLATSALVAFAGAASAEIAMKGYARFGVQYTEGAADEMTVDQRMNIDVTGTGASDNGLAFSAKVRMRAEEAAAAGTTMSINGARYSMSAGGMELAVGNIYGAVDSMAGLYAGSVGLTGLGYANVVSNWTGQSYSSRGAGVNGVELTYSVGDLSLHLSTVEGGATEVAVGYSMNGVNVAVASSDAGANAEWVATVGTTVGGVGVGLAAASNAGDMALTLSGSFSVGSATSVTAYVANDESQADASAFGLGVVHNLGGGASVRGGVASTHGTNRADLGVQFNF